MYLKQAVPFAYHPPRYALFGLVNMFDVLRYNNLAVVIKNITNKLIV